MSDSIEVVGVLDPRTTLDAKQVYTILKNGIHVTSTIITTNSYSNSSIQISAPPPSDAVIVDRLVWLKLNVTAVFDVDVRSTAGGLGLNVGLRQWPINSVIENLTSSINGVPFNVPSADIVHPMTCYAMENKKLNDYLSLSASYPDQWQQYYQWTDLGSGGSARNPLAAYGENPNTQTRGAILPTSISGDGKTLTYSVMEPLLFLSPFIWDGEDQHTGLFHIRSNDYNIQFRDLSRMFSVAVGVGAPAVTSINVSIANPELHITYITPSNLEPQPPLINYPYCRIDRYPLGDQVLASGATTTKTFNSIQLTSIPKRLYIYLRQQVMDQKFTSSDCYASISAASINFNNVNNFLSSMSQEDLFIMCKRNGLDMSYVQFSNFKGSVIAIDPVTDFGLTDEKSVSGLQGQYNFSVRLTFTNTSAANVTYTAYLLSCSEGVVEVTKQSVIPSVGVITQRAALESHDLPSMDYNQVKLMGGSVFGRLKSFISKARPVLNKISRGAEIVGTVGRQVLPEYSGQFDAIRQVGSVGRRYTGGGVISRSALRGRGLVDV